MDVVLPERNHGMKLIKKGVDDKLPVLYLLHEAGEDHSA